MTTVIFADRDGSALGALGERVIPALLPVRAELLFERTLRALVASDIRTALVVVGPRGNEVKKRFGKGIRWGIALEYVEREEGEAPGDVLRRVEARLDGDTVVVRGDVGTESLLGVFLSAIQEGGYEKRPLVTAVRGGRPVGFWRISPGALKKVRIPREPAAEDWAVGADETAIDLGKGAEGEEEALLIDSVAAFRRADHAEKPAISPRATVHKGAIVSPGTTVAEEAIVLPAAHLKAASVLPRTVIPGGVILEGAVVMGNLVLEAQTGATSRLTDRLPTKSRTGAPGFADRVLGAFALLLSLPLWPVAFFWSLIANSGRARRPIGLSANDPKNPSVRAPLSTFEFETAIPVFKELPLLLAVVAGRLALTGVAPLTVAEEDGLREDWERVRQERPVGLLAMSRLVVPASAPDEVARVVDAFEARRPSSGIVSRALGLFFSRAAWTAPKAFNPDELEDTENRS